MASTTTNLIRIIPLDRSGETFMPHEDMPDGLYVANEARTYACGPMTLDEYNAYADEDQEDLERPEEGEVTILVQGGIEVKVFEQHWDSDGQPIWSPLTQADLRLLREDCEVCHGAGEIKRSSSELALYCGACRGLGKKPYNKALCSISADPHELQALVAGRVTFPPDTAVVHIRESDARLALLIVIEGPDIPASEPGVEVHQCRKFVEVTDDGDLAITFELPMDLRSSLCAYCNDPVAELSDGRWVHRMRNGYEFSQCSPSHLSTVATPRLTGPRPA